MLLGERAFLGKKVVHSDGTLAFEEAHNVRNRMFGWNFENHVHVIGAGIAFQDFHLFLFCQFSDDLSNLNSDWSEENFLAIFWYNDHVVCAIPYYVAL